MKESMFRILSFQCSKYGVVRYPTVARFDWSGVGEDGGGSRDGRAALVPPPISSSVVAVVMFFLELLFFLVAGNLSRFLVLPEVPDWTQITAE